MTALAILLKIALSSALLNLPACKAPKNILQVEAAGGGGECLGAPAGRSAGALQG